MADVTQDTSGGLEPGFELSRMTGHVQGAPLTLWCTAGKGGWSKFQPTDKTGMLLLLEARRGRPSNTLNHCQHGYLPFHTTVGPRQTDTTKDVLLAQIVGKVKPWRPQTEPRAAKRYAPFALCCCCNRNAQHGAKRKTKGRPSRKSCVTASFGKSAGLLKRQFKGSPLGESLQ